MNSTTIIQKQQQLDLREYLLKTKQVVLFHEIEEIFMFLELNMVTSALLPQILALCNDYQQGRLEGEDNELMDSDTQQRLALMIQRHCEVPQA